MKLSELLSSDPSIRAEIPTGLEQAATPLTKELYATRIGAINRAYDNPECQEDVVSYDTWGKANFHTNVILREHMFFNTRRKLPFLSVMTGVEHADKEDCDRVTWAACYTGNAEIDIETIAACQAIIQGIELLQQRGLVELVFVNNALR